MSVPASPAMSTAYTHSPSLAKDMRNAMSAMSVSDAASPSMPSMRLIAFVMRSMRMMVSGMAMTVGMACMPKSPYRLLM